jgi:uncharacterized protein
MSKTLCIYHGNCADGFGAAWVVRRALGADNVDFHPGVYGAPPPDIADRNVIIVDFSYKRSTIEEMAQSAKTILILDHHKTAQEDLAGFSPPPRWNVWHDLAAGDIPLSQSVRVTALFDMERSGAGIAWDYFFSEQPRPALINHIEDRDLWLFKLDGTREIQAAVFSYPWEFSAYDEIMRMPVSDLRIEGAALERNHLKDVGQLVTVTKRRMIIGGQNVPVANLPYTLTSDAGNLMAAGEPFAACYWDTPGGRVFSLRSHEEGADVSQIAKAYGGGGHVHAAGFTMPRNWEGDRPTGGGAGESHSKEDFIGGMVKALMRRGYRNAEEARGYALHIYRSAIDRGDANEADILSGDPAEFVAQDVASWSA